MRSIHFYISVLLFGLIGLPMMLPAQVEVRQVEVQLPFTTEKQRLTVKVEDGLVFLSDDILLGREEEFFGPKEKAAVISGQDYRWENGIIPYTIEKNHPLKSQILSAIQYLNNTTNLAIIARRPRVDRDYVEFIKDEDKCYSKIGRRGGRQAISIGEGCGRTVVHEICHAAGLYHEQSRMDRDKYVTIYWNNIEKDKEHNFQKYSYGFDHGPYDYNSVMHYGPTAFGCRRCPPNNQKYCDPKECKDCKGCTKLTTIEVKSPPAPKGTKIGQNDKLSAGDLAALNALYPCPADIQLSLCGGVHGLIAEEQQFLARETIVASQDGCSTLVWPFFGHSIEWRAGREIVFHPGFQAISANWTDASFSAYIENCAKTLDQGNVQKEESNDLIGAQTAVDELNVTSKEQSCTINIYPNPFSRQTTVSYSFTQAADVKITLYDAMGRFLRVLIENRQADPGSYDYTFDAADHPPGLYFVRFQIGAGRWVRRMVLTGD